MESVAQQDEKVIVPAKYIKKESAWLSESLAGPLCMISAALLFTMMSILIKQMDQRYTVWNIGFIRFLGGFIVLNAVFGRKQNLYKGNNIPILILRGFTGSIAFIASITAIRILPISTSIVIFYSFPVFAAIFSAIIYKERIGLPQIFCVVLVMAGVAILFDFTISGKLFGQFMALTAGAFAGLTVTLISSLRKNNDSVIIYLYFCIMGIIVTLPMFINDPIIPLTFLEWSMLIGIIITSVVAQIIMNQGFFYCRGWEGGVYMSSETIFTSVIGILLMNDPVSWRFWVGGTIIMGSGIFLNWLNSKKI
ncbi:MAG: DMT family transporter [Desulfamplus sp.]|nr:DMT family transporter [Desulfamplus sp.]